MEGSYFLCTDGDEDNTKTTGYSEYFVADETLFHSNN